MHSSSLQVVMLMMVGHEAVEVPECCNRRDCDDGGSFTQAQCADLCKDSPHLPHCGNCCEEGKECPEGCARIPVGVINNTAKCRYQVVDKTYEAFAPVILEAEVEETCNITSFGRQHLENCAACAALNKPCDDQYSACGGCCGTKFHTAFGLDIRTKHDCKEVKKFFQTQNSEVVECEDEDPNLPPRKTDITVNFVQKEPDVDPKILEEGWVSADCTTAVNQLFCTKIPFKLKFECDACGLEGSPILLTKCCDKCAEWVESLETNPNIPANIKAFGWCSGCDVTHVDSGYEGVPDFEWEDSGKYDQYSEDLADKGMDEYLDEHVCKLLTPSCDDEPKPEESTIPGVSVVLNPRKCMTAGEKCGAGERSQLGRRLSESSDPDHNCAQWDNSSYPLSLTTTTTGKDPFLGQTTTKGNDSAADSANPGHSFKAMISVAIAMFICFRW